MEKDQVILKSVGETNVSGLDTLGETIKQSNSVMVMFKGHFELNLFAGYV